VLLYVFEIGQEVCQMLLLQDQQMALILSLRCRISSLVARPQSIVVAEVTPFNIEIERNVADLTTVKVRLVSSLHVLRDVKVKHYAAFEDEIDCKDLRIEDFTFISFVPLGVEGIRFVDEHGLQELQDLPNEIGSFVLEEGNSPHDVAVSVANYLRFKRGWKLREQLILILNRSNIPVVVPNG